MSEQIQTEQAEKPNEEDVISAIYNEIESKKNSLIFIEVKKYMLMALDITLSIS